ncbi:MAG: DUF3365 domain-containing protein [Nitrospirae bacterium]|nr:MAG: DUF3365 domain-containing protein [Nitrospirota bacterium]
MVSSKLSLKVILTCSLILTTALSISFTHIQMHQQEIIAGQLENEARVLFKQIVITRQWIADHGGIYVEKLPWTKPSQYIKNPEIADVSGKRYIKKTPAMVTKDLALYTKDRELFWFHITSLKLINPENAPDAFEKDALVRFEKENIKELNTVEIIEGSSYFRYISPLYVKESCLTCHGTQGYKVGDVRGAISITLPMSKTVAMINDNKKYMFFAGVITVLSTMTALYLMLKKVVLSPLGNLKESISEFSKGRYNVNNNLKTGDEFEDICRAFGEMTTKINEYHRTLNERINSATYDLTRMNKRLNKANNLLQEANDKKSDFIARASHELRTPLTSIKGAMDYISAKLTIFVDESPDKKSIEDLCVFFDVIKKNAERLIRMVNGMLDLERIELGAYDWRFVPVNLSHLIAETLTYLQVNADEKGIFFSALIPERLPTIADEDRIKQVLINLISNAIKFSPEGSEITLKAYIEDGHIVTEVCDEGIGIKPSSKTRIFEKFYKEGNKEGAGLGLSICKSIIDAHNGIIDVKINTEKISGSCFYFKIPEQGSAEYKQRSFTSAADKEGM